MTKDEQKITAYVGQFPVPVPAPATPAGAGLFFGSMKVAHHEGERGRISNRDAHVVRVRPPRCSPKNQTSLSALLDPQMFPL